MWPIIETEGKINNINRNKLIEICGHCQFYFTRKVGEETRRECEIDLIEVEFDSEACQNFRKKL